MKTVDFVLNWQGLRGVILAVSFLFLGGCTTLGTAFNSYHSVWHYVVQPTKQSIDMVITVRIRGFGTPQQTAGAYIGHVSPPELWIDVGEDMDGKIMIPPHIIGHELIHAMQMRDKRIKDPDLFREMR